MEILTRKYSEQKITSSYSKVAWLYDFWSFLTETKAANKILQQADIQNHKSILEVAVGTGLLFSEVVKRNSDGTNVGIDISPDMLSKAEHRLKKKKLNNYKLLHGSAFHLPFEAEEFDILINSFMIDLFAEEDFPRVIFEFKRVLKPGGKLIVATMSFGKKWYNRFWIWISQHVPSLLTGCRAISLSSYLQSAGFSEIKLFPITQNTFPTEVISSLKK